MKLPNQTHGPVTLSRIDYAANLSEETSAFTAVITVVTFDGKTLTGAVKNDGHGGANMIHPYLVEEAVSDYAKTLPPHVSKHSPDPLSYDADFLISTMVGDAIDAHAVAKRLSKTVLVLKPDGHVYCVAMKGRAVAEVVAAVQKFEPTSRVLNTMPFEEALAVYKAG